MFLRYLFFILCLATLLASIAAYGVPFIKWIIRKMAKGYDKLDKKLEEKSNETNESLCDCALQPKSDSTRDSSSTCISGNEPVEQQEVQGMGEKPQDINNT